MSLKYFFAGLAITSLAQVFLVSLLIWWIPSMKAHLSFIAGVIAAMIFFCSTLFGAAKISARSSMAKLYIQLIMLAVFLKMLLCLVLILGYQKIFHPLDNLFIWPFLIIYLTSTIYEVIFLEKVGRERQTSNS